jgi:hypothetical protein
MWPESRHRPPDIAVPPESVVIGLSGPGLGRKAPLLLHLIITHWTTSDHKESSSQTLLRRRPLFLRRIFASKQVTNFWAVICSHQHRDHARGLIKLIQNKRFTYQNCWMHDLRQHISRDARQATARNSSEADALREIVETTSELAGAFAARNLTIASFGSSQMWMLEPFNRRS